MPFPLFGFVIRDCNNHLEGRIGKLEAGGGGIRENDNKREGGLDVKFNTYTGEHYFFIFANWKSSGRVTRVQILILTLE